MRARGAWRPRHVWQAWARWTDSTYNGEYLVGYWFQGQPYGAFLSKEMGTGARRSPPPPAPTYVVTHRAHV